MVVGVHRLATAEHRADPAEIPVQAPSLPLPLGVEPEAAHNHEDGGEREERKHRELCNRVMTDGRIWLAPHEEVPLHLRPEIATEPRLVDARHEDLAVQGRSDDAEQNTPCESNSQNHTGGEVNEPHGSKREMRRRLAPNGG